MKQHPLSAAFPAMAPDEYQALVDSVTINGVINPITIYEGMVLDGWHRFNAANEAGVACPTVELGDVDPQAFVIAQNKDRRHIAQGQLALAVAAVYQWKPLGANQHGGSAPGADPAKTTAQLAQIAGVGTRTMEQAKAVEAKAAPKVKEAVKSGEISVKRAAEIAKLPAKDQVKALHEPKPAANDEHEDDGPSASEVASLAAAEQADREALQKLLDSDDKLATAHAEIKRLNALNAQLEHRLNGLMNEKNEAIKLCKSLQRRLERAERAAA